MAFQLIGRHVARGVAMHLVVDAREMLGGVEDGGDVVGDDDDLPAGSDTANLSVIGYDPHKYYSGRSPLEAASMGIDLKLSDVTYRCNTVTLSEADSLAEAIVEICKNAEERNRLSENARKIM